MSVITPATAAALRALSQFLLPPPRTTCLQWADDFRYLSPEASAQPGKYLSARAPFQREPQLSVCDPDVAETVMMWAAQLGKTEILLNVVGFHIDSDPAPILAVQPNGEFAESWSKERFTPMLRDTPTLRGKVQDAGVRDGGNTVLHKLFPGGNIAIVSAQTPAALAGRPRRVVLLDEIDRYPKSAGREGDPCALAIRRTETFHNAVIVRTSTPTIRGDSRIEKAYEESDQRQWFCPCPKCGEHQVLVWSQVKWPPEAPEEAWYECVKCAAHLTDKERVAMVRAGEWRARFPRRKVRGYHLSGLNSVFRCRRGFKNRLHQMVADFLKAKNDPLELRTWTNTFLGETWQEDADRVEASELEKRAENYGEAEVPAPVLLLTAGVDLQADRMVVEVVGWGEGEESWGIRFETILGRPDNPDTWKRLDAFLSQTWKRADGTELPVLAVGVDSGNWGDYVLKWTRSRFARGIIAVKGGNQALAPIVSAVRRNNRYRAAALTVGTDLAKSMIYSRLKQTEPGPGTMHFPKGRGFDAEFYSELTAEELRFKILRGFRVREWHKTRLRNEALDVRVYAFAVLRWLNPDFVRVAALQKRKSDARVERPADPNESGHINPAPGATTRPDRGGPKVATRRPAKSPVGFRSFTRGWRRY